MSREIKFRAWDKESRGWIYSKPMPDMSFWKWVQYDSTTIFNESTGLKDKNGVEIYEGDIITIIDKVSEYNEKISREKFGYFVVHWSEQLAGWYPESLNGYEPDESWWSVWDTDVIGNIYENPELLKAEEQ